ncbi:MAG: response regulator [Kofleriaceae bacterium]|nr:response regulator [Kofleriaceae bacterium]MBP6840744.1 response regulator [Kofleriaceae bacterium]
MSTPQAHFLIVDDDQPLRERLGRALASRGFVVHLASDHASAMATARQQPLDRAVVDLRMPGPSGLAVIKDLLELQPELQIVVVTGYGSIATAVEAVKLGAWDYLTKPSHADQILATFAAEPEAATAEQFRFEVPSLARLEWEHIARVLRECNGNVSKAARVLGMHRRTLQYKLAKFPVPR